jgi:threonine aldolase
MFMEEYVQCDSRKHKTSLIRQIIDILLQSGYRFLRPSDANGIFAEISHNEMKKKSKSLPSGHIFVLHIQNLAGGDVL